MVRLGADGADLGPTVEMKPLAGHRDECPVAPDAQVVPELDGPWQKRARRGCGNELEHFGDIAGTERDRLRAVHPAGARLDHLHQIERLDGAPAVWQLGGAVPAGYEASGCDETGGVLPVLDRRRRGQ